MATDVTLRIPGTEILHDEKRERLEELINLIREDGFDGEFAYRPPTGRGITYVEITFIYLGGKLLDAATGQIMDRALKAVIARRVQWVKARTDRGEANRPQLIQLYGPDGKKIGEVRIEKDETHSVDLDSPDSEA
jgi:hypothetical protein